MFDIGDFVKEMVIVFTRVILYSIAIYIGISIGIFVLGLLGV